MPFVLSDDERLVRQTVREFARGRIGLDAASEADRHDRPNAAALDEAAGLGLLALAAPPEQGGAGATAYALAIDELAQVDASTAAILAVHAAAVQAAAHAAAHAAAPAGAGAGAGGGDGAGAGANPALAALGALAKDRRGTFLVHEEAYGSDTSTVGTRLEGSGAGATVSGQKAWGLGAATAHFHVVQATSGAGGREGAVLLAVPADAKGVDLSQNEPLLGLRAAGIRTVYLSKVKVGAGAVLARGEAAARAAANGRAWLQLGAAAALTGCVAGALEAARGFASTRVQFGAPIGTYQAVSDAVAQVDVQLAAARALVLEAAGRFGTPEQGVWAARAKVHAAETAIAMTRQAIRIQGGTGFMREGGTERFAREARALQFVGETAQMQRDAIKRAALPDVAFPPTP